MPSGAIAIAEKAHDADRSLAALLLVIELPRALVATPHNSIILFVADARHVPRGAADERHSPDRLSEDAAAFDSRELSVILDRLRRSSAVHSGDRRYAD